MLWRKERLIVELDGAQAHSTAAQLAADARRQRDLEALGYTVIRFSRAEVDQTPDEVLARTRAALRAAG
jgi:very-short-patch-repair endonuclease